MQRGMSRRLQRNGPHNRLADDLLTDFLEAPSVTTYDPAAIQGLGGGPKQRTCSENGPKNALENALGQNMFQ